MTSNRFSTTLRNATGRLLVAVPVGYDPVDMRKRKPAALPNARAR